MAADQNPLRWQDLVDMMERIHDMQPAWITHPRGRLQVSAYINHDDRIYVIEQSHEMFGVPFDPALEPVVVCSQGAYLRIRRMLYDAGLRHITDRQLAAWYAARAEAERIEERGIRG